MQNKPISDLTEVTSVAADDTAVIVQGGVTKKVSAERLAGAGSALYATAAQGAKADSAQQPPAEGAFVDGDKTKLDSIETGADVTDTANVTAAGALMDSEVANLEAVKAFDPTDYATAAQGATADTAQQPPAEGAFVDGDKTKLDGIEAGADVTDTANVTAAGALMDSEVDADIKTLSLPANTTISTFGASLVDDADAATARATLGLGTGATATIADYAPLASPALTGTPTAPTPTAGDNSTKIATTAYVDAAAGGGGGLIPISKTVISGTPSAVDITLSGYDVYFIRVQKLLPSASCSCFLRLSSDSGSTFVSSGYAWALHLTGLSTSPGPTVTGDNNDLQAHIFTATNSVFPTSGFITLVADRTDGSHFQFSNSSLHAIGGFRSNSASLSPANALRLFPSTGNWASGEIHVYGYAEGDA